MSTIDNVKVEMKWQSSRMRPACRNCRHGKEVREDRMPPFDTAHWKCTQGGFRTSAMAVCDRYMVTWA